jgi:hypothetical protein
VDAAMRIRAQLPGPADRPARALPVPRLLRARGDAARGDARGRARLPGREPGRGPDLRDRGLRGARGPGGGVPAERARAPRLPRRCEAALADARRARRPRRARSRVQRERHHGQCPGTIARSTRSRRRPTSS